MLREVSNFVPLDTNAFTAGPSSDSGGSKTPPTPPAPTAATPPVATPPAPTAATPGTPNPSIAADLKGHHQRDRHRKGCRERFVL